MWLELKHSVWWTYLSGDFAVVDPAQTGEVGGFGAVKAVVEASVVAVRKRDHELSGLLRYLIVYVYIHKPTSWYAHIVSASHTRWLGQSSRDFYDLLVTL